MRGQVFVNGHNAAGGRTCRELKESVLLAGLLELLQRQVPRALDKQPQALPQALAPLVRIPRLLRLPDPLKSLEQHNVVGPAERSATLLQDVADGVDARLLADLLVHDGVDDRPGDLPTLRGGEEILVAEVEDRLLELGRALEENFGELVVDKKEDEGDGLDGLLDESDQGGKGRLLDLPRLRLVGLIAGLVDRRRTSGEELDVPGSKNGRVRARSALARWPRRGIRSLLEESLERSKLPLHAHERRLRHV